MVYSQQYIGLLDGLEKAFHSQILMKKLEFLFFWNQGSKKYSELNKTEWKLN